MTDGRDEMTAPDGQRLALLRKLALRSGVAFNSADDARCLEAKLLSVAYHRLFAAAQRRSRPVAHTHSPHLPRPVDGPSMQGRTSQPPTPLLCALGSDRSRLPSDAARCTLCLAGRRPPDDGGMTRPSGRGCAGGCKATPAAAAALWPLQNNTPPIYTESISI